MSPKQWMPWDVYHEGDLCLYGGKRYRCTVSHVAEVEIHSDPGHYDDRNIKAWAPPGCTAFWELFEPETIRAVPIREAMFGGRRA